MRDTSRIASENISDASVAAIDLKLTHASSMSAKIVEEEVQTPKIEQNFDEGYTWDMRGIKSTQSLQNEVIEISHDASLLKFADAQASSHGTASTAPSTIASPFLITKNPSRLRD